MSLLLFSWSGNALAYTGEKTPSGIPLLELEKRIDDFMSKYVGETSPGAAVVLIKDGEIIFSKGYGYADIENEIRVDPSETIFEYGSISKLFVYTTIMRLWEEGRIDLRVALLTTNKNRPTMEQTLREFQPMQVYKPGEVSAYSNYAVGLAS